MLDMPDLYHMNDFERFNHINGGVDFSIGHNQCYVDHINPYEKMHDTRASLKTFEIPISKEICSIISRYEEQKQASREISNSMREKNQQRSIDLINNMVEKEKISLSTTIREIKEERANQILFNLNKPKEPDSYNLFLHNY